MTNSTDAGEGARRARSRKWRWWSIILGPLALAPIFYAIRRIFWPNGVHVDGALDPQFAIYIATLTCILSIIVAILYHRIIDEHEERAFLWGAAVGFYLMSFGGVAWFFLATANLLPLWSFLPLWLAFILIGAAVQLWRQFR